MLQVLALATIIVPIVMALVELIKRTVTTKKNYIPLIAFVMGIFIGFVSYPFTDLDTVLRVWAGAVAGLASTGLFEITNYRDGLTKEGK
ncbi:holin [Rummeliibacillus stabekisii]|uniref:holin n=1 Tax=Rummeliibacillus stabekisii TaxID=241244 RepID=UPI003716A1BB